ncbi:MAG: TraB/GumN family protein [Flavobacteriaceae bacterium]|nr:TraB/GumN family protein [Flavobacteriaceae bacterium]
MKKTINIIILLIISQSAIGQNTILWKVTDSINHKTSFILGTFHQFGNSFVDSLPEIKESLLESELAIFESISNPENTRKLINGRKKSDELGKSIRKREFQKLKEISEDWKVDINKLKPIELRWKLQQEFQKIKCKTVLPEDQWDHFDNYLIHIAKENDIEVYGLETDNEQLNAIEKQYDSPDWESEKSIIKFWIKKLSSKQLADGDCSFTNKYRAFDLDYNFSEDCPNDILIKQRNEQWMNVIPNLIKAKNCFIAVGYRHLMNNCGLIMTLKENGLIVEPINLKPISNKAPLKKV